MTICKTCGGMGTTKHKDRPGHLIRCAACGGTGKAPAPAATATAPVATAPAAKKGAK